jgi:hypothetical protein
MKRWLLMIVVALSLSGCGYNDFQTAGRAEHVGLERGFSISTSAAPTWFRT